MKIENIKVLKENDMVYPEQIAMVLQALTENPGEDIRNDLTDALYQIQAMAQNEYNNDYYRVLYNILSELARYDYE